MKKLYILLALFTATTFLNAQTVTITPTQLNFNSVIVGKTRNMVVRLQNTSFNDVLFTVSLPSTPHYGIQSALSLPVSSGQSYNLTVQFAPGVPNTILDSFLISHDGDTTSAKNPTLIRLMGVGVPIDTNPKIAITQRTNNLGNVKLGRSVDRDVIIKNVSDTIRTLTGTISSLNAPYTIVSGGGSFSLETDDSVIVKVRFSPVDTGLFRDTLTVNCNAHDTSKIQKITFNARGIPLDTFALLSVSRTFINCGQITLGQKASVTFSFRNSSDVPHTITGTLGGLSPAFSIKSGGSPFTLANGDSVLVTVEFAPTLSGAQRDTVLIFTNSSDSTNQLRRVILTGTGLGNDGFPRLSVTPQFPVNFDSTAIGASAKRNVTVTNTSDSIRTLIGSIGSTTGPAFVVTAGSGSFSLDSSESRVVEITFNPTSPGIQRDTFYIASNANSLNNNVRIVMSGIGVQGSFVYDVQAAPYILLTPNPAARKVTVGFRLERAGYVSAILFDAAGKEAMSIAPKIYSIGENSFDFDCYSLAGGSYFVRITTPDGAQTLRLVKE